MNTVTRKAGVELLPDREDSWRLEPESGVEIVDGVMRAVSLPFWLKLQPGKRVCKCRWIRIRYSAGFFDEPVRPLIRFDNRSGEAFVQPMNGAVAGSAEWIGRVPDGTVSISISPGRRLGPFSFRIERIDVLSRPRLLQGGFLSDPLWAFWAVRSRLVDSQQEAWQSVKYALGGTPLNRYGEWMERMARPLDLHGFDRPRADWSAAPRLFVLASLAGRPEDLSATLESLQAQAHDHWWLLGIAGDDTSKELLATFRDEAEKDRRLLLIDPATYQDFREDDRIAVIQLGDVMPPYALAAFAEALIERPDVTLLYSDEDAAARFNSVQAPIFKPDWSPIFNRAIAYIGRLAFVRHGSLIAAGASVADLAQDDQETLQRLVADLDAAAVGHIRRVLYRRKRPKTAPGDAAPSIIRNVEPEPDWPEVSVVIPTRDRAHLLNACTRGLREMTDYPSFNVVVVDNGSTQPQALALLDRLRADSRFRVLDRPEPFNYAKLSNDGARATNSPMLVFLNNDIRMLNAGWLKAIVRWAMKPQVGVVGAKLLFPNGKIQHAGIVLGMGGISGHIYRRFRGDVHGYLHQAVNAREMAAVTGACIAIDRSKYEAVGGFDAGNLPVDLNDIDLCLRVAERGWTNVWVADALLTHVQSASRGVERNPFAQYRQERTYFIQRWVEAIRDDPYFHPGFSLSAHRPVLA